jgi:hypothetical protein
LALLQNLIQEMPDIDVLQDKQILQSRRISQLDIELKRTLEENRIEEINVWMRSMVELSKFHT